MKLLNGLKNWWTEKARLRAPRFIKVPERAMAPAEVLAALAVDDAEPLWRAVHQVLDGSIADAIDQACARPLPDPRSGLVATTAEVRTYHAGGVEHLRDLQDKLLDLQAKAKKREADEEEAEGQE